MSNHEHFPGGKAHDDVLLSVDIDYIPEELQIRAKTELHEDDENTRIQGLASLRSLLEDEKDLHWQNEDQFLLMFLRARKFDVANASYLVKGFYNCIKKHGNIYYNLTYERLKFIMEENSSGILRYRNYDGCIVVYFRMTNWNPKNISAEEHLAVVSIAIQHALQYPATQISGFQIIGDLKDFTLKQFAQANFSFLMFVIEIVTKSQAVRFRGLHAMNGNNFARPLFSLIKRFLPKKLADRVHLHGTDYKNLHKFVDPRILPAELDGQQPPFSNEEWRRKMEASYDYISHFLSFGYTES